VLELDLPPDPDLVVLGRPVATGLMPVVVLVPNGADAHQVHVVIAEGVIVQGAVFAVWNVGEQCFAERNDLCFENESNQMKQLTRIQTRRRRTRAPATYRRARVESGRWVRGEMAKKGQGGRIKTDRGRTCLPSCPFAFLDASS
jgi:hypothetical protein